MSARSRSSSASSFDDAYIDSYFSKTYVPLSNLPTPPPSSHSHTNTSSTHSPNEVLASGELLNSDLMGPATHLTNLIPSSTSLTSPSVPLVYAILTRASLPLETIALAVCILDSLNSRFALTWRQGCPLLGYQHVDEVHPELIVLCALVLAVKFLDDRQQTTWRYKEDWGRGLWSCEQINFTQRCILENLGYRLLPLWEESIILEALEDMERAVRQPSLEITSDDDWDADTCFGSFGNECGRKMSNGKAVLGLGDQLTPVETPVPGNIRGTKDLCMETKTAFRLGKENQQFQFHEKPDAGDEEAFPVYMDPMMEGF
ncbi:hypothetical protein LSUE1_G007335 [Lachnellula suecica]|uniref:Cyclin N-terminal domain-containing protein n=1 Tax=Lachnellula suecica TaxID=602035 RepID=A0A8T9C2H7_9HELO|nr:hypothetical protein LSUE1_G007335 [Lachnellula suecica]